MEKGRDRFLRFQLGSSSCEEQQAQSEGKEAELVANAEGSIQPPPQDDLSGGDGDAVRGSVSTTPITPLLSQQAGGQTGQLAKVLHERWLQPSPLQNCQDCLQATLPCKLEIKICKDM